MTTISLQDTVGGVVGAQPSRARVFEKLGVDYCCGGRRSLDTVCQEQGISPETLLGALAREDARKAPEGIETWPSLSLSELADHIVVKHHDYLREALPRLATLTSKVRSAHGERHPELGQVCAVFDVFHAELDNHMVKEERILFPICRQLEEATGPITTHCGSTTNPITVMEAEHDSAGDALRQLRELTGDFVPPTGACNTYRTMLDGLAELEADMHVHIHKENSVLFPRTIAREMELASR
ncbi:MAG TPA: iron-sulfur cluster repair di-iron protein [Capsulimonadaceae bacterium]|jgi:regulator of cell morphogenesis and NO signaling